MLSYIAQKLILAYQEPRQEEFVPETSKIKISEIASRAVFWYEKLRNTLEYNEEHLLLKNAIFRILKRRTFWEKDQKQIAAVLIAELIRAHYLPNNALPDSKIGEVQSILNKYFYLRDKLTAKGSAKSVRKDFDWLLQIAASEIEENLIPQDQERALSEVMYEVVKKNLTFKDINLSARTLNVQLFIAIQRALLKADSAIVRYRLLKYFYPEWKEAQVEELDEIISDFANFKEKIDTQINHPWGFRLNNICQRYAVYFLILKDVIEKYPRGASEELANQAILQEKVKEACQERYRQARLRLRRSGVRSIAYIFVTKMLLAMAIEIPLDYFISPEFNYLSISTNVLFPPLLMLIIVVMIRMPSKENTDRIVKGIREMVYEGQRGEILPMKTRLVTQKGFFSNFMFKTVYLFTYLLTFGLIIRFLLFLEFNIFSIIIFILFLCLVSFFGYRIRQTSRELLVYKRENFRRFIFDFLSLPIVRMGRWISLKSSKINVFVYFLDFVFEAPFKILVESIEKLSSFISEKKEEV